MGLHMGRKIKQVENKEVVAPNSTPGGGGSVAGGTVCVGASPRQFPKRGRQEGQGLVARREETCHSTHMTVMWALVGHMRANLPVVGAKIVIAAIENSETGRECQDGTC